jgi:hypothetical protein
MGNATVVACSRAACSVLEMASAGGPCEAHLILKLRPNTEAPRAPFWGDVAGGRELAPPVSLLGLGALL